MWSLTVAAVMAVFSALLVVMGGFDATIGGVSITAHDPLRPLLAAALAFTVFILTGGHPSDPRAGHLPKPFAALASRATALANVRVPTTALALALAVAVGAVGFIYGSKVGGGSDSYGYLSEAELWLQRSLKTDLSFANDLPWSNAPWSFTPLGYRPGPTENGTYMVPVYSPGLPMILALVKAIGGQTAMFLVVPLFSALFVLATFGIGRRVASPSVGLIGAWLVATSPIVLYMCVVTMTDVPVAAAWTIAFWLLVGSTGTRAFGAGLMAGVAALIRPNLVPLAGVMALHYLWQMRERPRRRQAIAHGALYALGLMPSIAAIAGLNQYLYGSPFESGYGHLSDLFSWSNIRPNVHNYGTYLLETNTPVVLLGVAALCIPSRRLWPGAADRHVIVLMAAMGLGTWALYLPYGVFDAWWYLRFLLTSWPFFFLGVGALAAQFLVPRAPLTRLVVTGLIIALGLAMFRRAMVADSFGQWKGERRYIAAAQMARSFTDHNSIVMAMQHSGSVRYYGGRMTLRYDSLDEKSADVAIQSLRDRGVRTYLLAEDWEIAEVRRHFGNARAVAALDAPPIAVFREPGLIYLFDMTMPPAAGSKPEELTGVDTSLRGIGPAPAPRIVFNR